MDQVPQPAAEVAYLFRHAVVRDAVYELQLPSIRADLHLLAAEVIQRVLGRNEAAPELADHLCAYRELSGREDRVADEAELLRTAGLMVESKFELFEAMRCYLRWAELVSGTDKCQALKHAALAAQTGGMFNQSEKTLQQLQALSQELDDPDWQDRAARLFCNLYIDMGRMRDAQSAFERANVQSDGFTQARLLANLDRPEEAEASYRRELESARKKGDLKMQSRTLGGLSVLLFNTGRSAEGTPALREALALARQTGDVRYEGFWTGSLGVRVAAEGNAAEADRLYEHALNLARISGDRRSEAMWLSYMASNAADTNRLEQSEALHLMALELACEIGDVARESLNLGNLACLKMQQGALDEAAPLIEQALKLDRRAGSHQFEAAHLCDRARLLHLQGKTEQARADWKMGTEMLLQLGDTNSLESCRTEMRQVCEAHGIEPLE